MDKEQIRPLLTFSIMLNKQSWKIRLYSGSNFSKLYPKTVGMTEFNHKNNFRTLNFKSSELTKDTIAHELMHAYASYYNFSRKKADTIEEKFCEIIGKKYKTLFNLTTKIYKKLSKHKKVQL